MNAYQIASITAIAIIEILYIGFCFRALLSLKKKYLHLQGDDKQIATASIIFLLTCLLSSALQFAQGNQISKFSYILTNQCEIIFLIIIKNQALKSKRTKNIFQIALIILLLSTLKIGLVESHSVIAGTYFCVLTLVTISIAFVFFKELGETPPKVIITSDPKSQILFGLFFGNSLFLIASICFLSLALVRSGSSEIREESKNNPALLFFLSFLIILTKACYLPIFYSIKKAFK